MIHEDRPNLDELQHYGVLGMKWGKTRTKANSESIHGARARVNKAKSNIEKQQTVINSLKGQGKPAKQQEQNLAKMKASLLKNPDRVLSTRMTKGEKFASVILGSATLGPVGLAGSVAAIGITSAKSRSREQKINPN